MGKLKKLADEKFNGKLPKFQDAKFDQPADYGVIRESITESLNR